jgi:hypothetical protein
LQAFDGEWEVKRNVLPVTFFAEFQGFSSITTAGTVPVLARRAFAAMHPHLSQN